MIGFLAMLGLAVGVLLVRLALRAIARRVGVSQPVDVVKLRGR